MSEALLDRRMIFVTGKGGVGKTTVAAALARTIAARGRRVIVAEVGEQERLPRLFGVAGSGGEGLREVRLEGDLWALSIEPFEALREWLAHQLGSKALMRALFAANAFQYFAAAAPGTKEMTSIVKVWELVQDKRWSKRTDRPYDTVVVDAPASGHGLAMLRTPKTFSDLARVGPIRAQADRVWEFLTDSRRSGYVAVSTAAEMPVTETLELERKLTAGIGRNLGAIVCNGLLPRRFDARELEAIGAAAASRADGDARGARAAFLAARAVHDRARVQQSQLARLRRHARAPVVTLPYLFQRELDLAAVDGLAAELGRKLSP